METDQPDKTEKTATSRINWFVTNPWAVFVAWFVGIAGGFFAVYTYVDGKSAREFKYFVSPARATVLERGRISGIEVRFEGQPIETDVTAAQIAIWNAGKLSIKRQDVLKTLRISTDPVVPILEASVRTVTRDVANISVDSTRKADGVVVLDWDILEQNDGATLQVIYGGNPSVNVIIEGVLEGQPTIDKAVKATSERSGWIKKLGFGILVMLALGYMGKELAGFLTDATRRPNKIKRQRVLIAFIVLTLLVWVGLIALTFYVLVLVPTNVYVIPFEIE